MPSDPQNGQLPREFKFPTHEQPRVWFLTCADSAIGISLSRQLLLHGDCVLAGITGLEWDAEQPGDVDVLVEWIAFHEDSLSMRKRYKLINLDVKSVSQCQAAVAEGLRTFKRIDILFCCRSECVVGTVEELGQDARTLSLVQNQFETNFFGPVNLIKSVLPIFRSQNNGHIIMLTAVTAHLGTPGLSVFCASQWAIEGYCDSLAYEIAPFNIKLTIVQPNMEVNVLTNRITCAPPMLAYEEESNPAPFVRNIFSSLLDQIEGSSNPTSGDQLHSNDITSLMPELTEDMKEKLVAETVYAVAAIGGHENPPARHIVGLEGIQAVKEKLKTVSEELEDFAECSGDADIERSDTANAQIQ